MDFLYNNTKVSDTIFSNIQKYTHEEYQYLNLLDNILENGVLEEGRNGKTKSIFGHSMRFSLSNGKIPILTTKKTAWKTCLKELLWFIKGQTDNNILKEQGVHIWDENASRDFLDSRGLHNYQEGELGPIYGWQWRNFNGPHVSQNEKKIICESIFNCWTKGTLDINPELKQDYDNLSTYGVDQLQNIIDALKDPKQRTSRRLIMTSWNPCQLSQMALPPCHILCQFNVHDGNKLSCSMYQRSVDTMLGQPFNIASYSFLTHLLAKHCGLEAYEFVYFMGNTHIYETHIDCATLQLTREPFEFPTLEINNSKENINDYIVDDFKINNYQHHAPIKMEMVA
jgi:thymidylate synthase